MSPGATSGRSPPDRARREHLAYAERAERPQVRPVVDQVRRELVVRPVPRQERHASPGHGADGHRGRRGAVRRLDGMLLGVVEERVEAAPADHGDVGKVSEGRAHASTLTSGRCRPPTYAANRTSAGQRHREEGERVVAPDPDHDPGDATGRRRGEAHDQVGRALHVGARVQRRVVGDHRGRGHGRERPAEAQHEQPDEDLPRAALRCSVAQEERHDQQQSSRRQHRRPPDQVGEHADQRREREHAQHVHADHDADDAELGAAVLHVQRGHHHHRDHGGVGAGEAGDRRREGRPVAHRFGHPAP